MGLEIGSYISALVSTNPIGATDPKSQGDDHIRFIKAKLLETFPNVTGAVTATHTQLNFTVGATQGLATLSISLASAITLLGEMGTLSASVTSSDMTGTIRNPRISQVTADKLVGGTLTKGYATTPYNAGTITTGTLTPNEANGAMQYYINGGAHTLAPPTNSTSICLQMTNNATAGAITTTGFTYVTGSTLTTTNGDDFFLFVTRNNGFIHLHVQKLQT